jgi:hypothetical protein
LVKCARVAIGGVGILANRITIWLIGRHQEWHRPPWRAAKGGKTFLSGLVPRGRLANCTPIGVGRARRTLGWYWQAKTRWVSTDFWRPRFGERAIFDSWT